MYLLDRWNDGWMAQQERRLLQNTHQTSNETVIVKNSLQAKKKLQGSPADTHTEMTENHLTYDAGEY